MSDFLRRVRSELARFFGFARRDAMGDRFDEEARYHVDMQVSRNLAAGMTPGEARRAALVAFGGRDRFGEAARDEVRSLPLDELQRDVRFSLRTLRRAPAFAFAAILTLALGIGATTVIFSVTDHVVLRPLAYAQPERLVLVREIIEQMQDRMPSVGANASHFLAWRGRCSVCEDIGAFRTLELTLRGAGDPQRVGAARATANLLPLLGARAQLGRLFTEAEDADGAERVVVLTDGFWRRQFGARRDIIGQTINLSGVQATVIGVLEPGFALPQTHEAGLLLLREREVIVPLRLSERERTTPGEFSYNAIARLRPGATPERAQEEFEAVARELSERNQAGMTFHALVVPLQEHVVGPAGRALILLLVAVGALLAIVCVNLANLLFARNAARMQESAVRVSLGAGRRRLVRQALTESLVLALLGGALGILLSRWGLATLLHFAPATLPRLAEITLDGRVLGVALLVTLGAGLTFGVLPALRFSGIDPGEVLKGHGGRTATEGRAASRVRGVLVATQVGLSALLLVATGLFLMSFVRVLRVDKGFAVERALALNISLPGDSYPTRERGRQFYDEAITRLGAVPGVSSAAVTTALPLEGDIQMDVLSLENDPRPVAQRPVGSIRYVSPEYFDAVGTPLREGRIFTEADRARKVVLLSERSAQALFPNERAIGKRFWPGSNDTVAEVIGLVADIRTTSLEKDGSLIAYLPYWQNPQPAAVLLVRSSADPTSMAPSIRAALRAFAPTVPVSRVRTLEDVMSAAVAQRRFQLSVLALFALTALVTASVGIYGVVAHSLRRRTAELGVRMALGARPGDVQRLVLRQGMSPVFVGLAVGLVLSVAFGGLMRALLFNVAPGDPVTLAGVAVVLGLVAAVACWIPAWRATRMDLVRALRQD
jgi:predicted permease